MNRATRIFMVLALLLMSLPGLPVIAAPIQSDAQLCASNGGIYDSTPDGSNFCAWAPSMPYEGDLVIFAHGYVDPATQDGSIPWGQLSIGGVSLPAMVMGQLHAAFAITSYPHNGLSVVEGVEAVKELAVVLKNTPGLTIQHTYIVGASEGGLVTALAIEQNPDMMYAGGVSTCGPVGNFVQQINYWGDFRVAYDYYFQKPPRPLGPALPLTPINIAPGTITAWGVFDPANPQLAGPLQGLVYQSLVAHPNIALKLVTTGKAPYDPADPANTILATALGILDYNVKATDQGRFELSGNPNIDLTTNTGNPYGNTGRWIGTWSDAALNIWVQSGHDKFVADPAALAEIQAKYQTTGKIKAPLVDLHTTGDPIVPYWHELMYLLKVWSTGNGLKFFTIPVQRYGHCAFTAQEAMFAYVLMVFRATGTIPTLPLTIEAGSNAVLTQQDFNDMMKKYGPTLQQAPNMYYLPFLNNQ